MKLAECAGSRQNNFNALRLLAASIVVVSHCFALTGRREPFASISGQSFGELGVSIFFAISGFLIARSWSMDPAPSRFVIKRALRLLPALIIAVLVTALVIGPAVTTLPLSNYFASPALYRYIAENSVLYTANGHLPGVFTHNIYPHAVNGSLWTLPVEAFAYVGAAVLGAVGALTRRVILATLSFIVLLVLSSPLVDVSSLGGAGPVGGNIGLILYLGALFNAGMVLYALRRRVSLRWDVAAVLMIAWIATYDTEWVRTAAILCLPYCILALAYRAPAALSATTRSGDLSYGIYIYAFPLQQLAVYIWGPGLEPGTMLALVAVPLYLVALASWRLIEAPALRLKPRSTRTVDPRPALV